MQHNLQPGLAAETGLEIPRNTRMQVTGKNPIPLGDSQYFKLQRMSSQQAVRPVQTTTTKFPFAKLFPFILPQLDKDRAMQLEALYEKLKKNEIARDQFVRMMGGLVGNEMLKLAAAKLSAQPGVHRSEIQVQISIPKDHTGRVVGLPIEPQTVNLLHQKSSAEENKSSHLSKESEENKSSPSLSVPVHPYKERNAPITRDTGRSVSIQLSSQMTSSPAAMNGSSLTKKPYFGQNKPLEMPDTSLQPLSKKQKISGPIEDLSIEELNDVTAVSGVNLREEAEQLLPRPREDSQVSEGSLRAVREEKEKLLLEKVPLQKKLAEIMAKCGMKNVSKDVERCLSLRVDVEKHNRKIVITSDIHQHLMILNRRAKEELEKKEAEAEKQRKLSEPESNSGLDGKKEKDESRGKSRKVNKQEDDKMRTTAANFAARAAVGGDDLLSKWQLMAEQAQQRREGVSQFSGKSSLTFGRITADSRGSERGHASLIASGAVRKQGKNQTAAPQQGVSRSISIKDVISVLEREPQMSKSTLMYKLYNRTPSNPARDS
ncbi:hypothetical protein CDL15_Pgr010459 [Punica granatum]|uniref:RST domain-containing protein n=1 Tax=Punica granatum TaxID=22663 RepID=A0A218VXH3_PUNGR|nr:hypothetical protein CDL15_Pgr010459 [Punica granatum]